MRCFGKFGGVMRSYRQSLNPTKTGSWKTKEKLCMGKPRRNSVWEKIK